MNALQRDLKKLVPLVESLGKADVEADPYRQQFHLQPPVGWLVGTRGACYGQSFCLRSGRNRIGRSAEMDVNLDDGSVSRTCAAVVIYDPKERVFSAMPGESSSLCYVNNHALYQRMELQGYDLMEFGDAGLNQFIFVPLCGNQFRWEDYPPERK